MGLTLVRLPLAGIFAAWVVLGPDLSAGWPLALTLLALMEVTDALDGFVARRWGGVSELGAVMDPFADSVTRMVVYAALAAADRTSALLVLVMALRDVTVSYCRVIFARHGATGAARISGKLKAWAQGAGAFVLLLAPEWVAGGAAALAPATWAVGLITALSAVEYVRDALRTLVRAQASTSGTD
jgi:CDP-diacylglycerol--glycerol-3-phosphate 3-phosphatidyltransferase